MLHSSSGRTPIRLNSSLTVDATGQILIYIRRFPWRKRRWSVGDRGLFEFIDKGMEEGIGHLRCSFFAGFGEVFYATLVRA